MGFFFVFIPSQVLKSGNKVTINLKEKAELTEGYVGDKKTAIRTNSEIVINNAGYPGAAPTISKNETGYVVKNIDGTEYKAK